VTVVVGSESSSNRVGIELEDLAVDVQHAVLVIVVLERHRDAQRGGAETHGPRARALEAAVARGAKTAAGVEGPDPEVRAGQAGHVVAVVEPRRREVETAAVDLRGRSVGKHDRDRPSRLGRRQVRLVELQHAAGEQVDFDIVRVARVEEDA